MNCEEARTRWHQQLEEPQEAAELARHLAECAACQQYTAEMQRIVDVLDELRRDTESIVSRAPAPSAREDGGEPQWWNPRWVTSLTRAAAVLAILVGGGALYYASQRAMWGPVDTDDTVKVVTDSTPEPCEAVVETPSDPRLGISLRAESAKRMLAVAQPTSQPDVQMYWLYPVSARENSDDSS